MTRVLWLRVFKLGAALITQKVVGTRTCLASSLEMLIQFGWKEEHLEEADVVDNGVGCIWIGTSRLLAFYFECLFLKWFHDCILIIVHRTYIKTSRRSPRTHQILIFVISSLPSYLGRMTTHGRQNEIHNRHTAALCLHCSIATCMLPSNRNELLAPQH